MIGLGGRSLCFFLGDAAYDHKHGKNDQQDRCQYGGNAEGKADLIAEKQIRQKVSLLSPEADRVDPAQLIGTKYQTVDQPEQRA